MSVSDVDDDVPEVVVAAVPAEPTVLPDISEVWECDKVEMLTTVKNGKTVHLMKCLHCGQSFTKSVTKMRYHLSGLRGHDIKVCQKVPDVYKPRYKHLLKDFLDRQALIAKQKRLEQECLRETNRNVASNYEEIMNKLRKRMSASASATAATLSSACSTALPDCIATDATEFSLPSVVSRKRPRPTRQTKICVPSETGVAQLDVSIADFIHSNALPESLADCPKLREIIEQAHYVPIDYKPPRRQEVGGKLLDLNYEHAMKEQEQQLEMDKDIFGLTFYGVSSFH